MLIVVSDCPILSLEKADGCFYELGKLPASRLIVGYSQNRAKKDAYNREKGVRRLKKAYNRGTITKEHINKRGYNKFLDISDFRYAKSIYDF